MRRAEGYKALIAGAAAVAFAASPVMADDGAAPQDGTTGDSIADVLPGNGDIGGVRRRLAAQGVTYGLNYIGEAQGNVTGGVRKRTVYVGRLEAFLDLDLERIGGWRGFTAHANAYQIHGDGLSTNYILNLMPASYIEAHPTTRLFELWGEQKLFDDMLAIRFGQLAADTEFFTSGFAGQFINGTFGWPAIHAANLPSGGPAYPLATPGVRVQVNPTKSLSLLAAVFNGDPAGRCDEGDDPQECNRYGVDFRLSDSPFVISELQYRYNQDKGAAGLAGTIKIGGWHHFGNFDDIRFGTDGVLLADTAGSNGFPIRHRGNSGIYGVIDQQLWRPSSGEPDKGIGIFGRVSLSPDNDRNLVSTYVDGGLVFAGLIPGRPDDAFSFGAAYARISKAAREFSLDEIAFGAVQPARDYEALLEANYQFKITSGWTVDADFQYIWHPGGNVPDPVRNDGSAIKEAAVLALHTQIKY